MEAKEVENLSPGEKFCRLCFKQKSQYLQLFENQLFKMLESLTSIKISWNDPAPHLMCFQCYVAMRVAYTTQQKLIKSERFLREKMVNQIVVKEELEECLSDLEPFQCSAESKESENHQSRQTVTVDNPYQQFFRCETCMNVYDNHAEYIEHTKSHEMRQCCLCPNVILTSEFKEHYKTHESGLCEYCGAQLKHSLSLRKHVLAYHRDPQILCERCGEILDGNRDYDTHTTAFHTGEPAFKCDECGAQFYKMTQLRKHGKQKHPVEKPYMCEVCGHAFGLSSQLKAHAVKHSEEILFVCEMCGKGFKEKHIMDNHKIGVHKWKPTVNFTCKFCNKGFVKKCSLHMHMRKHK